MSSYLHQGYTVLVRQLEQLASLIREQDPNVGAVILFGSTARLTPEWDSDVDLLFLCQHPRRFLAPERDGAGISLLSDITSPQEEWGLIPVVSDLGGSDLSEALLANIAQDGVLIYQQPGVLLLPVLAQVCPYAGWLAQVQHLLERTRPISSRVRRTRPPSAVPDQAVDQESKP